MSVMKQSVSLLCSKELLMKDVPSSPSVSRISVTFMLMFCCMGLIAFVDVMEILRSDSDYLELLCLLINLPLICLVKLVNHCLYDHAIENAKLMVLHVFNYDISWAEDDKEKINIINQPKGMQS